MAWPWQRKRQARRTTHAERLELAALRARYDAAQTTDDNRRHWVNADFLSPDAAMSPSVRRTLRSRARYEVANNCYAMGLVQTVASDTIGSGPRLQMLTKYDEANQEVEATFAAWTRAIRLPSKLRTMRIARAQDGEAFGLETTNRRLAHPVKLDLALVEADQVTTPDGGMLPKPNAVDGIVFDDDGNPVEYHVLKVHPGSLNYLPGAAYNRVPAEKVLHWFREDRPGQRRGIPDLTPALPLFAYLRRFTLATIAAAETAANLATVMGTDLPGSGEAAAIPPYSEMPVEVNTALFAPEGWKPFQLRAEHPATTYDMFKREIVSEIARCLNVPYNVAACDSSRHNYASGRLDHQIYIRTIETDQRDLEVIVLDRLFASWMEEARLVPGLLPPGTWVTGDMPHTWMWPGLAEIDPRWVSAEIDLVMSGLQTEADYQAKHGKDWQEIFKQREREQNQRRALSLPDLLELRASAGAGTDLRNIEHAVQDAMERNHAG